MDRSAIPRGPISLRRDRQRPDFAAKIYLPDAKTGYYRATRFDWCGVIGSLEYNSHNYYGPWFARIDPAIDDFGYEGDHVIG